jgi:hypothetical protein
MGDFEFHIDLLISLVEARTVLWDTTDDSYKERNGTKKHGEKSLLVFKKTSKL